MEHVRERFGRIVYTHKTHEKDRERLTRLGTISKWTNIALCALTFGGVLSTLTTGSPELLVASVVLATLSAGYALVQLSWDPISDAARHRAAAKQLLVVRNGYESLIADLVAGAIDDENARARRDELEAASQDAFGLAPDTSPRAYAAAQKALKVKEDMTFSDEELNAFLPRALQWPPPK